VGLAKRDHIRALSRLPRVAGSWQRSHGQAFSEADLELVVAAALHDLGYHPLVVARFPGLPHEAAGAALAAELLGERVAWLIAQHVPAKRYLVASDLRYAASLSEASVRSLAQQGGPMSHAEVEAFESHPWSMEAARLRRWDDAAKVPVLRRARSLSCG
jgi:gamma-butyrobetaine dioxygenase